MKEQLALGPAGSPPGCFRSEAIKPGCCCEHHGLKVNATPKHNSLPVMGVERDQDDALAVGSVDWEAGDVCVIIVAL